MTTAPGRTVPGVLNAMTIDVEDYFQVSAFEGLAPRHRWDSFESRVEANTTRLLDLFDETSLKGTFFILGWVAERFPGLVRDIAKRGHELASHGYHHRLVYDITRDAFRDDIRRSKDIIEAAGNRPVVGYRAPSYSITPRSLWAFDILIEQGYRYDASVFPIHHDRYGIPPSPREPYVIRRTAGALIEAPGSAVRVGGWNLPVGGGGYFRLLPYGWTRWGLNRINRQERRGAIFYLHPWEVDPDQPRIPAGLLGRIRHYRNLGETEARLRRLIADFEFGPLQALLKGSIEQVPDAARLTAALPYLW
jgi:polysaccharide deacetylase family protein (PEP-CTERM system associated)